MFLAANSTVPLIPGYDGLDQDPTFLAQQADQIGYPIMIKASAGGGGKGMRIVHDKKEYVGRLSVPGSPLFDISNQFP